MSKEGNGMKISGTSGNVTFDYENGYVLKAEGELLTDGSFTVYRSSIQNWEPPYNHIRITQNEIDKLVEEVDSMITEKTIQIEFI
ncbi:Imm74 family immunity protein [Streptococcus oralis]|uniref:Imm74 family immunity protein n=2 Tax=Streptococcus TaxID=1301 RepID=UPI0021AD5320|nr:Imm74 family immunity protein [Streptococcus oralis]